MSLFYGQNKETGLSKVPTLYCQKRHLRKTVSINTNFPPGQEEGRISCACTSGFGATNCTACSQFRSPAPSEKKMLIVFLISCISTLQQINLIFLIPKRR